MGKGAVKGKGREGSWNRAADCLRPALNVSLLHGSANLMGSRVG